jgi:hypothetical protein
MFREPTAVIPFICLFGAGLKRHQRIPMMVMYEYPVHASTIPGSGKRVKLKIVRRETLNSGTRTGERVGGAKGTQRGPT